VTRQHLIPVAVGSKNHEIRTRLSRRYARLTVDAREA
jgi:hypothetical protein